jgi:pyridoxamine 5'-phosphate oxidase
MPKNSFQNEALSRRAALAAPRPRPRSHPYLIRYGVTLASLPRNGRHTPATKRHSETSSKLASVTSPLRRRDLDPDPFRQFRVWFDAVRDAGLPLAEAMALATASADGVPSARIVLLKGIDSGFVFFTNYESRKGRELDANSRAALVFHWQPLGRQVRVEGTVERVSEPESADYFETRPRGAQLGAWASPQSEPIGDRAALEGRLADVAVEYEGREVPAPPFWGGYRVVPERLEFWQHRDDRLHDRFAYERDGAGWRITRLAP